MSKHIYTLLFFVFTTLTVRSQQLIVPGKNVADKQWIQAKTYQMDWSMLMDTMRITIGTVNTNIAILNDKVQVITNVTLKAASSSWVDTTIVRKADLSPVYHASYNSQRDMVLYFGKQVKGWYTDKTTGMKTGISQETATGYFDSNFYPLLIGWLPLQPGYKAEIPIYDYNPDGKNGIIKAYILDVTEGTYKSTKLGLRKVWSVTVKDEIGNNADTKSIYEIDQLTRQLYKQRITAGGRIMEMVLTED
jgi:hypothetical protein